MRRTKSAVSRGAGMKIDLGRYRVQIARTEAERMAAQRLRYRVFVEELGAKVSAEEHAARREWDRFDPWFDHLILIDLLETSPDPLDAVVGVYRLLRGEVARSGPGFYGASEYDLGPIEASGRASVELGRSCVAREHRGGAAMHLLWNKLAEYVLSQKIEILFGVASFPGTDAEPLAEALSYLHHHHMAPPELRVRACSARYLDMKMLPPEAIEPARALRRIPPLIKAYLRFGGKVGEGAFIDEQFNTIDVCVVMDTEQMAAKHRDFYNRNQARSLRA